MSNKEIKVDTYTVEAGGMTITINKEVKDDNGANLRILRQSIKMSRKDFAEWLHIPYRTVQDWELGNRMMPGYVYELIVYRIAYDKLKEKYEGQDKK